MSCASAYVVQGGPYHAALQEIGPRHGKHLVYRLICYLIVTSKLLEHLFARRLADKPNVAALLSEQQLVNRAHQPT